MLTTTFHGVFIDELKDLYDAENQLVTALPQMAKGVQNEKLKDSILGHLQETKAHVGRLEQVLKTLGAPIKGKPCKAMKGLIEEGAEALTKTAAGPVRDAQIIGAAQRVEHYEIAAYGTVIAMAKVMGHDKQADLLQETLDEEGEADKKLTSISEKVNATAFHDAPGM